MLRELLERGNIYFNKRWPLIAFQPILYFFVFGATLRLAYLQSPPPAFDVIIYDNFYIVWLSLGILSPVLSFISWFLIEKRTGRKRFMGMWLRLAADIGVFTTLITYHVTTAFTRGAPISEAKIFSRYLLGACILFTFILIIRDMWTVYLTERLASKINKESK